MAGWACHCRCQEAIRSIKALPSYRFVNLVTLLEKIYCIYILYCTIIYIYIMPVRILISDHLYNGFQSTPNTIEGATNRCLCWEENGGLVAEQLGRQ